MLFLTYGVLSLLAIIALIFIASIVLSEKPAKPCRCGMAHPSHLDDKCVTCRGFMDAQAEEEWLAFQRSLKS